jgi:hypothetical protein
MPVQFRSPVPGRSMHRQPSAISPKLPQCDTVAQVPHTVGGTCRATPAVAQAVSASTQPEALLPQRPTHLSVNFSPGFRLEK